MTYNSFSAASVVAQTNAYRRDMAAEMGKVRRDAADSWRSSRQDDLSQVT